MLTLGSPLDTTMTGSVLQTAPGPTDGTWTCPTTLPFADDSVLLSHGYQTTPAPSGNWSLRWMGGSREKKKGRESAAFPRLQDERLAVLFAAVRSTLSKILLIVPARRERGALPATLTALTRLTHLTALTRLATLTARLRAVALPWVTRVRGLHKSLL